MSSPNVIPTVPHLEVEQPRTFRIFKLVVQELRPPADTIYGIGGIGISNQQQYGCQHVLKDATVQDLIAFAGKLTAEEKATLRSAL